MWDALTERVGRPPHEGAHLELKVQQAARPVHRTLALPPPPKPSTTTTLCPQGGEWEAQES
jgi:hypothetical protein